VSEYGLNIYLEEKKNRNTLSEKKCSFRFRRMGAGQQVLYRMYQDIRLEVTPELLLQE